MNHIKSPAWKCQVFHYLCNLYIPRNLPIKHKSNALTVRLRELRCNSITSKLIPKIINDKQTLDSPKQVLLYFSSSLNLP